MSLSQVLARFSCLLSALIFLLAVEVDVFGIAQDVEYDYDGVIADDYSDWNRTIRDLITILPGYNCTGDPTWPYGVEQVFPCQILPPSESPPNSVHMLRPADINVIGAIGDSLTAANGAGACSVPQILFEYRGKSFSHGGDESYETVPTLANILRKYNPSLKGYGMGRGTWPTDNAGMNVAEPGAKAYEIEEQAERLVQKMKDDASIDYEKDWKLVTIFIGGNDLCKLCENPEKYSPSAYVSNIQATIQVLHDQMPRTFVNVIGILDLRQINEFKGLLCKISHRQFCPCVSAVSDDELDKEWTPTLLQYQSQLEAMVTSGTFDDKEDFTVVYQPFLHESKIPTLGVDDDLSYMAPDCFHFSAKGHAETGKTLWNNMVQPVGSKATAWVLDGPFTCPTEESPFLYTNVNSGKGAQSTKRPVTEKEVGAVTADTADDGPGGNASVFSPAHQLTLLVIGAFVSMSNSF